LNDVDCIVIGAGVVGLAVARAIARADREVIIIEREPQFGRHTSSRNSGVIHAGIHYEPGTLKAALCVRGRDMLYIYCEQHGIDFRRCGKLTVAASEAQIPALEAIERNALANGVHDLSWLSRDEAIRLEPELSCHAALWSPSTGIVDSHAYMQCLLGDAESYGANIAYGSAVTQLIPTAAGVEVSIDGQRAPSVRARTVVNCAGLFATEVAGSIAGFPAANIPAIHFARGNYFTLSGRSPFKHLVYPAPAASGHLGIHMTLDLAGAARFGPDLQWIERIDYEVDASRAPAFAEAIRSYWPTLAAQRLQPAYAGIRPKLSGPGEPARDFLISGPDAHGVAGIFNLFGIESPGLTASLALGDMLAARTEEG
jgi:L-2-hydroxyglutarate oxidase LhgO